MAKKREHRLLRGVPMGLGDAFRLLPIVWRYGQLSYHLLRDERVSMPAKAGLIAGGLLVFGPWDVIPASLPVIGELSDFLLLLAVIQLFLRVIPQPIVEEHIERLGLQGRIRVLLRPS
ncbi:MAG: hypothetical protein M1396_04505 [Chloroflexi bacterium]|nr:hypothetical protein [Chloroflexota bacterium]